MEGGPWGETQQAARGVVLILLTRERLSRFQVQRGFRSIPPHRKSIAVLSFPVLRNQQAMLLIFWILLLSPSLTALVTGCCPHNVRLVHRVGILKPRLQLEDAGVWPVVNRRLEIQFLSPAPHS